MELNDSALALVFLLSKKFKIKLIYFSTNYVYPGNKGNYKEVDSVSPVNNYAWSKLGGEAESSYTKNH